jgi:hypothetical protein
MHDYSTIDIGDSGELDSDRAAKHNDDTVSFDIGDLINFGITININGASTSDDHPVYRRLPRMHVECQRPLRIRPRLAGPQDTTTSRVTPGT